MDQVYLFSPGDSIRKVQKAIRSNADVVIIDLEDGVSINDKEKARNNVSVLRNEIQKGSNKIMLRINPITSPHFFDDMRLLKEVQIDGIMIPKCENPTEIEIIKEVNQDVEILPLIESAW